MTEFFVYDLIDQRDGGVFYVGKGKGNRPFHHEREALAGKRSRKRCGCRAPSISR